METEQPVESSSTPEPRIPIDDSGSLSDHEAEYGGARSRRPVAAPIARPPAPEREEETQTTESGEPPRARHRAKSQQASPDDLPRINELTKELREKEAQLLAKKPANGVAESPRLIALRRQIRGLEAELAELEPKAPAPAGAPVNPPISSVSTPERAPAGFTEREPTLEQFQDQADPWTAWQRALARYDRRKEAFEEREQQAQTQQQTELQQAEARIEQSYATQVQAFMVTHPDFQQKLEAVGPVHLPPLAMLSLKTLDKAAETVYSLTATPHLFAELHLLTDGKPITPQTVASTQRWLLARTAAVTTGAAPPVVKAKPPLKPPTPVRTGPMTLGVEPPDEGASLAAHEAFYHTRRRR